MIDDPTPTAAVEDTVADTVEDEARTPVQPVTETLVEEVSIDGMCGVY